MRKFTSTFFYCVAHQGRQRADVELHESDLYDLLLSGCTLQREECQTDKKRNYQKVAQDCFP